MPLSALLIHGVPIECINHAAVTYYVPAKVIISVLETEGGAVGLAKKNTNGSYDLGPMQINTVWLRKLEPYGYTIQTLLYNPCANVDAGTWILSQSIADSKESFWAGVGDYHSHTYLPNEYYQGTVWGHYQQLNKVLGQ